MMLLQATSWCRENAQVFLQMFFGKMFFGKMFFEKMFFGKMRSE